MVWTNEGRNESVGCHTKIPKNHKEIKKPKFEKEEDMMKWVESKIDEVESEDEALASSRSVDNNTTDRDAKDKQDSARDVGDDAENDDVAEEQGGYFSGNDANEEVDDEQQQADLNNSSGHGFAHQANSDNDDEEE